ncbi:hypothetical protein A2U01_0114411, partial [Trifolium medium]|nr:hypothetical protein [Trifolium medium]
GEVIVIKKEGFKIKETGKTGNSSGERIVPETEHTQLTQIG